MTEHEQPFLPRLLYLTENQARRIHAASLQILERTGAIIDEPEAVKLLRNAGAGLIVAAAVSSLFALRLEAAGYADARLLVPITFITIIGTVRPP